MKPYLLFTVLSTFAVGAELFAQSSAKGTVLISEDFSADKIDTAKFINKTWNLPGEWELRDGVIACLWEPAPGKGHGIPINPKFKAHNVRVSYRANFQTQTATLKMLAVAGVPAQTGVPIFYIGDMAIRLPRNKDDKCVAINERDFTYDIDDPRNLRKSYGPGAMLKPLGAYVISGTSSSAAAQIIPGQWHQFVFENVGPQWTLWIDGNEVISKTLKYSDCTKFSVAFIGSSPLLFDDLVIEELP